MMNTQVKLILIGSFLILTGILSGVLWQKSRMQDPTEHVHIHAGFHVYIDGVKQDYSKFEFMSLSPCSVDQHKKMTPEEAQIHKAHLHDQVGDVVHVHTAGATWGDLFQNIRQDFGDKQVMAYRDDTAITDILSQPIIADDSLVIMVGSQDNVDQFLAEKVSTERIKEVEAKSELCGATHE